MNIYMASSWRNPHEPDVVRALRADGHDVYDFRNPPPSNKAFHWSKIDPEWQGWSPEIFRAALERPIAREAFEFDMGVLRSCDACVLVLPSGRSSHLEVGWACAAGKITVALLLGPEEPELMYRMLDHICTSVEELRRCLLLPRSESSRNKAPAEEKA